MNRQEPEIKRPADVPEPVIEFRAGSDRSVYRVVSEKNSGLTLIEISGYDLQINFNMEYLRSYEDVKAASAAVGELFQEIMLDKLIGEKQNE